MTRRTPGRSVTSKVLAMLAAFEGGPPVQTLSQIAEAADLPLPTAHRLAAELVAWGALERDDLGRYSVGLRLWEVAQHAGRQLRDAARPFLQDLFSLTQETTHLAIRDGSHALYLDRIYSAKPVPRAARVGGRLPLHATAVGKVLLAFEEPWVRETYLARDLESLTPVRRTQLVRELAIILRQGYATTIEEARAGSCSIAVPVMVDDHQAGAAVGLVMLANQANQLNRYLPSLRGTAQRIEPVLRRWPPQHSRAFT